ncbi:hypothetical protein [Sulfuriroseicoccus oceanibius]|uniref:Uncharacterized protein n=1 Tax=Sulfuriroseicoccus oceanibius TaxID=2707525 RepID=A0A6B3LAL7_9BACT|nr:hypothetical protein [Sulfuriroseicoccus oceanibius]QQL45546.1 hypothetical protein G3M56_002860 [Sulfuriroseicoccus oceanibius]
MNVNVIKISRSVVFLVLLFIGGWCFLMRVCGAEYGSEFTMKIQVVDDAGKPVQNASVRTGLKDEGTGRMKRKWTDAEGVALVAFRRVDSAKTNAYKEGYYSSGVTFIPWLSPDFDPSEPLVVKIKRKKNPIAMYAKNMSFGVTPGIKIPGGVGEKIGFDLQVGDWVKPYGEGVISDFIFEKEGGFREVLGNDFSQKITITFSNEKDGLIPFEGPLPIHEAPKLRSDYEAPEEGYLSKWVQTTSRKSGEGFKTTRKHERNFYFRVRTKVDERGGFVSASYGKIYGDFMSFVYYLNPTPNDRNIEFDPNENLFRITGNDVTLP